MKKIFKMLLSISLVLSVLTGNLAFKTVSVLAASFTPRYDAPSQSDDYYYSLNFYYTGGYGMPNCTCYAYGRAYEILGEEPNLPNNNAGAWWWDNISSGAYAYGSTPKLGAIACWDRYDKDKGHVAVVEAIDGDTITISESHYSGVYFDTRTINSDSSDYLTSMRFLGYIYIGDYNSGPICGYDSPQENSVITGSSFRFAGWVQAEKQITDISCSINDGQAYVHASLYTRPDVPYATAFLIENVSTKYFRGGTNYVSVCVTYSDGSAETVAKRSVTFPNTICGFDYPTDNEEINDVTFRFQGWVDAPKEISSITCSINDGESYMTALLYTRPDVPNATAFLIENADSELLHFGTNYVSVCVNYKDGSGETVAKRTVNKRYAGVVDAPLNGEFITEDAFTFRGWVLANKSISSIKCNLNNGSKYFDASMYKREDVPYADAYSVKISKKELKDYENTVSIYVEYNDGTVMNISKTIIYKAELADMGNSFEGNIYSVGAKKLLTVDSTDNVVINSVLNNNAQLWRFNKNEDGTYTIISRASNKVLDNSGGTGTTQSNVQVYENSGTNAQKWRVFKSTGDHFYFVPACSLNCALDVSGNNKADGTNVWIYTYTGASNTAQQFKILRKDMGDVDANGSINKHDAKLLLKKVSNIDVTINDYTADINNDTGIDLLDVIEILKK